MSDCLEVVESLSQREKNKILSVLKKDEKLRQGQEQKISVLKREIQEIRMKGVLRAGDDQDKMCRRCRAELGFFFNRGSLCPVCRFKVCRNCQEYMFNGSWLCVFCYKQRQLKWMTGEWASFEQNPLRKWASGSDILRASFQLHPGPSIDVDEPQQNGSSSRNRKNARNGVAGGDTARSRLEAPRDGDQHKLSQLFDVLRPKKQDQFQQETQVRKVTTKRYHESDSESSSSSDVENRSGHSSPNALSVTESEKDAQVGDIYPIESPRLSEGAGSPRSSDSSRTSGTSERVKVKPRPAPRSPKPAPRKKHSDTLDPDSVRVDTDRIVRPKVRPERKSDVIVSDNSARLSVDDTSRVSLSRSVDTNLSNNYEARREIDNNRRAVSNAELNLQKHVNKTKESLERKQEAFKAESGSVSMSEQSPVSQLKKGKDKKYRKSADNLLEKNVSKTHEQLMNSDNEGAVEEEIVPVRRSRDNESAILMKDSPTLERKSLVDISYKTDMRPKDSNVVQSEKTDMQNPDDELHIQVPRAGSPYSVSMDSIPSSHPSPTFHRSSVGGSIGGSSHADSSDTDSLSRMSHPELGEFSGTESSQHGHDDDFVVEEISKIRFQRISKKVGQMGVVSKLSKSPRMVSAGGVEVGERGTQDAFKHVGFSGEGGGMQASTQSQSPIMSNPPQIRVITPQKTPKDRKQIDKNNAGVDAEMLIAEKASKTRFEITTLKFPNVRSNVYDKSTVEDETEKEVFEEEVEASQVRKPESSLAPLLDLRLDKTRQKSVDELSWYSEMDQTADWYKKQMKPNPRHSSVMSNIERVPSESDSIEGMIDDMVNEGPIKNTEYGRQVSGVESEGSFCMTPISPVPPEMYETNKIGTYRLTYISDDNVLDGDSENEDHISDPSNKDAFYKESADDVEFKAKLGKAGSLDMLLYDQGELALSENLDLDIEVQEALKLKSSRNGKSNSSSLDSLRDVVEDELSRENLSSNVNKEFIATVTNLQNLSAPYQLGKEPLVGKQDDSNNSIMLKSKSDQFTTVQKEKLKSKNSLDNLIDSQHGYIEDMDENIELDQHFHFLKEKEEVVESDDDVLDGVIEKEIYREMEASHELGKHVASNSFSNKQFNQSEKVKTESIDCKTDNRRKGILKPMSSIDVLLDSQGDLIEDSEEQVELNEEFVKALEQEFDAKNKISDQEIDIQSDFTYLGIQQNVTEPLPKDNIYHYNTKIQNQVEEGKGDHEEIFGETQTVESTNLAIRTIRAIPIGYLGQKDSEESTDSDTLSVIEEEDEADIPAASSNKDKIDETGQQSFKTHGSETDQVKGIVMKQKQLFEKQTTTKGSGQVEDSISEHDTHIKGKIFTKARDMESKVRGLSSSQMSPTAEKAKMRVSTKLHDKFKKLHDHWVAVEHHEADILDLDDEDDETTESTTDVAIETHDKTFGDRDNQDEMSELTMSNRNIEKNVVENKDTGQCGMHTSSADLTIVITSHESDQYTSKNTQTDLQENTFSCNKNTYSFQLPDVNIDEENPETKDKEMDCFENDKSKPTYSTEKRNTGARKSSIQNVKTNVVCDVISDMDKLDKTLMEEDVVEIESVDNSYIDKMLNYSNENSNRKINEVLEISVDTTGQLEVSSMEKDESVQSVPKAEISIDAIMSQQPYESHIQDTIKDSGKTDDCLQVSTVEGTDSFHSVVNEAHGGTENREVHSSRVTNKQVISIDPRNGDNLCDSINDSMNLCYNKSDKSMSSTVSESNAQHSAPNNELPTDMPSKNYENFDNGNMSYLCANINDNSNLCHSVSDKNMSFTDSESCHDASSSSLVDLGKSSGIKKGEHGHGELERESKGTVPNSETIVVQPKVPETDSAQTVPIVTKSFDTPTGEENQDACKSNTTHINNEPEIVESVYLCASMNDSTNLCHSISDNSVSFPDFKSSSTQKKNISDSSFVSYSPDKASCTQRRESDDKDSEFAAGSVKKPVAQCDSIQEGESVLMYRVYEGYETCHSIDESLTDIRESVSTSNATQFDNTVSSSIIKPQDSDLELCLDSTDGKSKLKNSSDIEPNISEMSAEVTVHDVLEDSNSHDVESKASEATLIPLKRLSEMNKEVKESEKTENVHKSSLLFVSNLEVNLTEKTDETNANPPHVSENPNTFKAPGTPLGMIRVRTSSSSIPSSPDLSTSSSQEDGGFFRPEKLAGFQESPLTISECSVSQDDSGSASGGSRVATPEHRRTDSGYSQSSLPSSLSTVTDSSAAGHQKSSLGSNERSEEEEDIDKVIANIHHKAGSRGNLLTVTADSRESIASYYSDAGDIAYSTVPVTGEILFGVNYNYKTSMLEIGVKQCKDIAVADTKRNRSDPYVKTYLLPDRTRSGKRKTKIKKHTMNPTFDETLKYSISKSELENRTLWVTLWHSDRFGRNIFLGEVTINFDYYKFDDPTPKWYQLQERMDSQPSSMMVYKGDLSLCIRYVPADKVTPSRGKGKQKKEASKGQLEVIVKEARNLTAVRSNGFSDPFCKGYLLPERHKSGKQKTPVIKKECNPVWNHTFVFEDVALQELRDRCLELTIWDYEKLSSNDFLGGVRLNLGTGVSQGKPVDWMDARGEEMSMWQAMLDRPNLWIDGALILRPNMEKRKF